MDARREDVVSSKKPKKEKKEKRSKSEKSREKSARKRSAAVAAEAAGGGVPAPKPAGGEQKKRKQQAAASASASEESETTPPHVDPHAGDADDEADGEARTRLASHSQYFDEMLELIPAKHYFSEGLEQQHRSQSAHFEKFGKHKKQERRAQIPVLARQAKADRLDPALAKLSNKDRQQVKAEYERSRLHGGGGANAGSDSSGDDSGGGGGAGGDLQQRLKQRSRMKEHELLSTAVEAVEGAGADEGLEFSRVVNETSSSRAKFKPFGGGKRKEDERRLLKRAEAFERQMAEAAPEDAKKMRLEAGWSAALSRVGGEKVRDNPKMLRKTIKRKEKLKERSQKKWNERLARQKADKRDRQEREDKKKAWRIEHKGKAGKKKAEAERSLATKMKTAKADSKSRAGFEGKAGGKFASEDKPKLNKSQKQQAKAHDRKAGGESRAKQAIKNLKGTTGMRKF